MESTSSRRLLRPRRSKAGLPPGTPVHIGDRTGNGVRLSAFVYNADGFTEHQLETVEQACAPGAADHVTWLNVDGVHDVATVGQICRAFDIHPLVQEDIVNTDQRPKAEEYDGYLFLTVKMMRYAGETVQAEQVSLLLTDRMVISFQEQAGDVFDIIRDRIRTGKGFVRRKGADYLAYCLLDSIVDHYYLLLEKLEERIEPLEESVVEDAQPQQMRIIQELKREMIFLRRSLWPTREMISRLSRQSVVRISDETRVFLRDLYDHVIHIIEILESLQELLSGTMEIYLSSISNRMNGIMKVLTIISTIFIPLTFIAGVYGMNFVFMPELSVWWAYPLTLVGMGVIAVGMIRFFRRKGWL